MNDRWENGVVSPKRCSSNGLRHCRTGVGLTLAVEMAHSLNCCFNGAARRELQELILLMHS